MNDIERYCREAINHLEMAIADYNRARHDAVSVDFDNANAAVHHAEQALEDAGPEDFRKMFPL